MTAPTLTPWTDTPEAANILATFATKPPMRPYIGLHGYECFGKRYDDLNAIRCDWIADRCRTATGYDWPVREALDAAAISVDDAIALACVEPMKVAA